MTHLPYCAILALCFSDILRAVLYRHFEQIIEAVYIRLDHDDAFPLEEKANRGYPAAEDQLQPSS